MLKFDISSVLINLLFAYSQTPEVINTRTTKAALLKLTSGFVFLILSISFSVLLESVTLKKLSMTIHRRVSSATMIFSTSSILLSKIRETCVSPSDRDSCRIDNPHLSKLYSDSAPPDSVPALLSSTHFSEVVGLGRFELPTPRLSSVCSDQLSYRPKQATYHSFARCRDIEMNPLKEKAGKRKS